MLWYTFPLWLASLTLGFANEPASIHVLLVTGYNHPSHSWRDTTLAIGDVLRADPRFDVRVVEDPAFLESPAVANYDVVLLNFADHQRPNPGANARNNLAQLVEAGKGLVLLHFASGAWDEDADFVKLAGRVWKEGTSGHDALGPFRVEVMKIDNPIVKGIEPYDTEDELYYSLVGDQPVEVLATAKSKLTGKDEPITFTFPLGKGRVFHTALGHDVKAIQVPGSAELLRRGCAWAAGQDPVAPAAAAPAAPAAAAAPAAPAAAPPSGS